jgi:hypothetical protein
VQEDLAIVLGWIAGADLPGGGGESESTGSGGESDTSGGEVLQACGIDDLKPGAPNPIDAGTGAMQIPPDIATILADNCGCHYADELAVTTVADYLGLADLATWSGWQEEHPSPNVAGIVKDIVRQRLDPTSPQIMPPPVHCNLGGGETMPLADRQTLIDWIEAGTPDGATWMP